MRGGPVPRPRTGPRAPRPRGAAGRTSPGTELALGRRQDRPDRIVGGGEQGDLDVERLGAPAKTRESGSPAERALAPNEVKPDVAVAEREPRLGSQGLGHSERTVRLVPTPTAFLVEEAGECVQHGVEIGGDMEAVDVDVVAHIPHRRHRLGPGGAASASTKRDPPRPRMSTVYGRMARHRNASRPR